MTERMLAASLRLGRNAQQHVQDQADFELGWQATACLHAAAPLKCPHRP